MTTNVLPPELFLIFKFAAISGLFTTGVFLTGIAYKLYKKFVGDEKARKYRRYFLIANIPLALIDLYLYFIFFR